jgi:histidinol dehydrogenase
MADMFQRRTSWVKLDRESLKRSASVVQAFSDLEGLDAHGRSVSIRLEADSQSNKPRDKKRGRRRHAELGYNAVMPLAK